MILEKYTSEFVNEITIRYLSKKYKENTAQRILVDYFLGKIKLYNDGGDLIFQRYIKVYLNKQASSILEINKQNILKKLDNEVHFLIDASLYHLHNRKGKKSLEIQISQSLKEIREFLFDSNLILVGDLDFRFLGKNMVNIFRKIENIDLSKYNAVILDPYAEEILTDKEIKKFNLYILGGIVDVGLTWHGATSYLFRNLNLPKRRIELDGSIKGVPDRINILIKIILEARYFNIPLHKAIIRNQTKKDILERLWFEIKRCKSEKLTYEECIERILNNVNISKEKLQRFLKENNIRI